MQTALILIAHGSRQEEANADLHFLVEELRRRGSYAVVEAAFLELAAPDADQAAQACVAQGARRVVLMPYFLCAGVHVRRDLTAICARLGAVFPQVEFRLAEPLGRHPLLLDIIAQRVEEAESS